MNQSKQLKLLWIAVVILFGMNAFFVYRLTHGTVNLQELSVQRMNVLEPDGSLRLVVSNAAKMPAPIVNGKVIASDRGAQAGLIFYNEVGDESGGLAWNGKLDAKGLPQSGGHFSFDRFGGDQQLTLGHYEEKGMMHNGLRVLDSPVLEGYKGLKPSSSKPAKENQDAAVERLFIGKTVGKSSALILNDAQGNARVMLYVTPEGKAYFDFLNDKGEVIKSLAPQ